MSEALLHGTHDLHRLEYFDNADGDLKGRRSIHISEGEHPYMDMVGTRTEYWLFIRLHIAFRFSEKS